MEEINKPPTNSPEIQNPINAPSSENKTKKIFSKKWIDLGLVLLFILSLGITGSFLYLQNNTQKTTPSPSPTPTQAVDETANWKTYTDTTFGFSFKYPEEKYLFTENTDNYPIDEGSRTYTSVVYCPNKANCSENDLFMVKAFENKKNWKLQEWIKLSDNAGILDHCVLKDSRSIQKFDKFLGKESVTFEYVRDKITDENVCKSNNEGNYTPGRVKNIFIQNKQHIIEIYSLNTSEVRKDELDQILSTFKFTDSDETANMKTYINTQENWQVNYPVDENIKILNREGTHIGPNGIGNVVIFSKLGPTQTEGTELHDGIAFTIGLKQKNSVQTIKEFADEDTKPDPGTTSRTPLKEITINGHKGVETTVSGLGEARIIYLEYPVYKDRVYYFSIFSTGPGEAQAEYDKLTENMLQSFKSYR